MSTQLDPEGGREARSRIFEAAWYLFRVRGYDGTSVGDIGERAGLTGPALYYHFGSKANLLLEVLRQPLWDQIAQCRAAAAGLPPEQALAAYVESHVSYLLKIPFVAEMHGESYVSNGVLAKSLEEAQREEVLALLREPVHQVRTIIRSGIRKGVFRKVDPTLTAFAVLGLAENVTWLRRDGRLKPQQLAQSYGDLAVAMVKA